ncbi:hypothetical protein EVJ58_g8636 [Rhodofomes roseus]|uniref:Uncharacterized protein n=1 Tax=Rhodofomes roseus TaxID=34475 RepID=A0A4Y9XZN9_9APHY|nr:hypothetical protein EVJ58_g8636 [Rhodofomes roseus]
MSTFDESFMKSSSEQEPQEKDPRVAKKNKNDRNWAHVHREDGARPCSAVMWHDGVPAYVYEEQ